MTKEQEEVINSLEKLINIRKNKAGQIKYDNCICSTTDLEIVLNMLKEKDADIAEYKNIIEAGIINAAKDELVEEKNKEIEKKDKIIDLMAKELQKHIFVLYDGDTITSKKGIIEHYERKVEDE